MAGARPAVSSTFERTLRDFKKTLSRDEIENFSFATLAELKTYISKVQDDQASSRRMLNLNRLAPFLEAMEQYDKVVQTFLNAADLLAFIWGPIKFLLETAKSFNESFNALLNAYEEIGETLPLLTGYEGILQQNTSLQPVLGFIYADNLDFHQSAMKYFKGPIWRQVFQAVWKNFNTKFQKILNDLARHRRMVDSHANLVLLEQLLEERSQSKAQHEANEQEGAKKRRMEVTRWISAPDSSTDQSLASSKRSEYPETGKWLIHQDSVRKWMHTTSQGDPILWINGKPGAGKTVLASLLVEECQKLTSNTSTNTVFFYCKNGDPTRNSAIAVFRSLLLQLALESSGLISYVYEIASTSGTSTLDDTFRAKEMIQVALAAYKKLYIVVDGLDECPKTEKIEIVTWLSVTTQDVCSSNAGLLRCVFFSQDDNDMGSLLKHCPSFEITNTLSNGDIIIYCKSLADEIKTKFELSQHQASEISTKVTERADGMFIFARLVMEGLLSQATRRKLRKECEKLPADLDSVYHRIIQRVLHESKPAERDAAQKILGWILCATRPLKWYEIQGAQSFNEEDCSFDFEDGKFRYEPKSLCGSLIEVTPGQEIRLVHSRAKTFLQKDMFQVSQQEAFVDSLSENEVENYVLDGYCAFMDYAAANWPAHLLDVTKTLHHDQLQLETLRILLRSFFKFHPQHRLQNERPPKAVENSLGDFSNNEFYDDLCYAFSTSTAVTFEKLKESARHESLKSTISSVPKIRNVIEKVAAGSDVLKLERLRTFHGSKHFKCSKVHCQYFHEGFLVRGDRDHHAERHELPYRCTFAGCPVHIIGFKTERDLRFHSAAYHGQNMEVGTFPRTKHTPMKEVCKMIRKGDLDELDGWINYFDGPLPVSEVWSFKGMSPLRAAFEDGNQDALKMILDHVDPIFFAMGPQMNNIISRMIRSRNETSAIEILDHIHQHAIPAVSQMVALIELSLEEGLDRISRRLLEHPNANLDDPSRASRYLTKAYRCRRPEMVRFLVTKTRLYATLKPEFYEQIVSQDDTASTKALLSNPEMMNCHLARIAEIAAAWDNFDFIDALCSTEPQTPAEKEVLSSALLLRASREQDLEKVERLLDENGMTAVFRDSLGKDSLYYAIERNQTCLVKRHLENPRIWRRASYEYLTCAIQTANLAIVRLLDDNCRPTYSTEHLTQAKKGTNREIEDFVKEKMKLAKRENRKLYGLSHNLSARCGGDV